jgi:hypothetical protein
LQRTSVRSSRGFRSSRRSPTLSRTSTASFLRSPATSCPSPASSDRCSFPSSTTSEESSRCALRPRAPRRRPRSHDDQRDDAAPVPETLRRRGAEPEGIARAGREA